MGVGFDGKGVYSPYTPDGLETCFQTLADTPLVGRSAAAFAPELRRYEIQSHVVFYRPEDPGALIVRVLHESRDFPRHL
jgi:toxin ParE1/3/4